jgi:hypothetical protein
VLGLNLAARPFAQQAVARIAPVAAIASAHANADAQAHWKL